MEYGGSGVASQFVGNDPQRCGALTMQESSKESLCSSLITLRLDQDVDDVAVLIHGSPQILLSAVDSNEDLIQVPVVAPSSLLSLQFPGIVRTELLIWSDLSSPRESAGGGSRIGEQSRGKTELVTAREASATVDHSNIRGSKPHSHDPSGATSENSIELKHRWSPICSGEC